MAVNKIHCSLYSDLRWHSYESSNEFTFLKLPVYLCLQLLLGCGQLCVDICPQIGEAGNKVCSGSENLHEGHHAVNHSLPEGLATLF